MDIAENLERRRRWLAQLAEAQALVAAGREAEGLDMLDRLEGEVDEVLHGLGIDPATVEPL